MFKIISVFFSCICLVCNVYEKKQLIEYIDSIPEGLDPAVNSGLTDTKIYSNIYESLLNLDEDGYTLKPGLADHWEIDPGLKRYVLL